MPIRYAISDLRAKYVHNYPASNVQPLDYMPIGYAIFDSNAGSITKSRLQFERPSILLLNMLESSFAMKKNRGAHPASGPVLCKMGSNIEKNKKIRAFYQLQNIAL